MTVFGATYAREYDRLYGDKDYDAEVALLQQLQKRHLPDAQRLVDFGCGSGQHALRLSRGGLSVVGVDQSPHMLALARDNAQRRAEHVHFVEGDVRSIRLGETFDVALMMFAVLGYQVSDTDVEQALATVRAHLVTGGMLVADMWYGPAVLATRPEKRTKVIDGHGRALIRRARTALDIDSHRADVYYELMEHVNDRDSLIAEETHAMRYFFADELHAFLHRAHFEVVELRAFDTDEPPSEQSWNVLLVARAV